MSKPETIAITIYPSGAATDDLTVSDAMQQVLDTFELLSLAEGTREDGSEKIVWRLERASTNSPLTIEAVAVAAEPAIEIEYQARHAKITLLEGLGDVINARAKPDWLDREAEKLTRRILERNLNGIGRMEIQVFEEEEPLLIIDHRAASRGVNFLELKAVEEAAKIEDLTREEFGSAEVLLVGTTTHYGRPAVNVRLRLSGDAVKCVLSQQAADQIGPQHSWSEVWSSQRALIHGKIHYNHVGRITLIEAEDVSLIPTKTVDLSEIDALPRPQQADISEYLSEAWGDRDFE